MCCAAERHGLRAAFLERALGKDFRIAPLAGDASFRRYFRVHRGEETFVLMDAPPGLEDLGQFLRTQRWLEQAGVRVPRVFFADEAAGLALIEDFGDRSWAAALAQGHDPEPLFADAWAQLVRLQTARVPAFLPRFDAARMHAELDLYLDWYLPHVAQYTPSSKERARFHARLAPWIEALCGLAQVPVHLDYHSRNLMLPKGKLPLGVLDFQDAATGPITYDAASLLYDCYQMYPEDRRRAWSEALFSELGSAKTGIRSAEEWHRWVRITALQRHVKAIGIFARLAFRDGKTQFLGEIPLTRQHLREELEAIEGAPREPLLTAEPAQALPAPP